MQAEEAYQLGPRQLAQFFIRGKGYASAIVINEHGHYLDHPSESNNYILEGFCHFAETLHCKGYPKYRRAFLTEGFWLAIADIAAAKKLEAKTIQAE
jgi:hypothetical protein